MISSYGGGYRAIMRWLCRTNHKDIGRLYFVLGLWSGLVGLVYRTIIRTELIHPGSFYGESVYNVLVTSHGLLIIFFMVMPLIIGFFGNWAVPLLLAAPDMVFARLNNLSFWLLPAATILLLISNEVEEGVGTG